MAFSSQIKIKSNAVEIICYLFILLFVYAAAGKLLDFEEFRVQIGQTPMLSAFANNIAGAVPAIEILVSLMLFIPKLRLKGLFAAFSLMIMFTTYIIIILNFTSYIPCSCGGVLEELGWTEHLIFNLIFILLALTAIILINNSNNYIKSEGSFSSSFKTSQA